MLRQVVHSVVLLIVATYLLAPSLGWIAYWVWEDQIADAYCVNKFTDPGCHGKCFVHKMTEAESTPDEASPPIPLANFLQELEHIVAVLRFGGDTVLPLMVENIEVVDKISLPEGHPP